MSYRASFACLVFMFDSVIGKVAYSHPQHAICRNVFSGVFMLRGVVGHVASSHPHDAVSPKRFYFSLFQFYTVFSQRQRLSIFLSRRETNHLTDTGWLGVTRTFLAAKGSLATGFPFAAKGSLATCFSFCVRARSTHTQQRAFVATSRGACYECIKTFVAILAQGQLRGESHRIKGAAVAKS
jgi:hypothetical protein